MTILSFLGMAAPFTGLATGSEGGTATPVSSTNQLPVAASSPAPSAPVTATIANGASLSGVVDLGADRAHRLLIPAGWTAAAITFQASADGATFGDLYDAVGEITLSSTVVAASRSIVLDQAAFYGIRYLKIRSGTAAAVVAQGAQRDITVVTVPR